MEETTSTVSNEENGNLDPTIPVGLFANGFRQLIGNKLSDDIEEIEEMQVPLTNIEIKGSIINRFAKIELIHYYFNPTDKYLSTVYKFPRGLMQVFDGLKIIREFFLKSIFLLLFISNPFSFIKIGKFGINIFLFSSIAF